MTTIQLVTWSWCPNCLEREDHDLVDLRWICNTCKQINPTLEENTPVTFEQFLHHVRSNVGTYCTDEYWKWKWNTVVKDLSREEILARMPLLAINAIGTHNSTIGWI